MLDLTGILDGSQNVSVFHAASGTSTTVYQTWTKPRGCKMLFMLAMGSGGGGGGGFTDAAGTTRGGGGGGAGAGIARLLIPAFFVPDVLYIVCPVGGEGGAAGVAGTDGRLSEIQFFIGNSNNRTILSSGATAANGGEPGTGSGGGAGGAAGSTAAATNCPLSTLGVFSSAAGIAGANGGAHTGAAGTSLGPLNAIATCGGTGGGGVGTDDVDRAGGNINIVGDAFIPGFAGGAAGGGAGNPGYFSRKAFWSVGGSGGGSDGGGAGGAGGNGSFGSGGGGGGAGTTGGAGGRGGDGLVVIVAF